MTGLGREPVHVAHGCPGAGPVAELVPDVHLHAQHVGEEPEEGAVTQQDLGTVEQVGRQHRVPDGVGGHAVQAERIGVMDRFQVGSGEQRSDQGALLDGIGDGDRRDVAGVCFGAWRVQHGR